MISRGREWKGGAGSICCFERSGCRPTRALRAFGLEEFPLLW